MKRTAVIMAGGSGERFWPLSRKRRPKQLLPIASEKMMLEESIDRISSIIPPEDVFIITSTLLQQPIREAMPFLPPANVIAEPYKRNTAPCLALAAAYIKQKYSDEFSPDEISIAVLTADQFISPNDAFTKTVESALDYVERNPVLCTIGIEPLRPETGYGYIEVENPFDKTRTEAEIRKVLRFCEKPTLETAIDYISTGRFLWNSGMFFWRCDVFIDSLIKHLPEVGSQIGDMAERYKSQIDFPHDGPYESIKQTFESFPDISIDYGLMERAENVVVAKALFNWDDIGSWDSLDRVKTADAGNNNIEGKTAVFDVKDSIIINASKNDKIIFAGFGLENMVVVITDDAVLVCPKDRVQEVKKCVGIIKDNQGENWL